MTSSNVEINPYVFDEPEIKALTASFGDTEMGVTPKRVGYRLLEDYFGTDVIEFAVEYDGRLENDMIDRLDNRILMKMLSDWRLRYFPEYSLMVSVNN